MSARTTSFRLLGNLGLVIFVNFTGMLPAKVSGAPAPKTKPYALLYIPKKMNADETARFRRSQIASLKTNESRFVLYAAIRSLKNTDLPSLPKKGKGQGGNDNHSDDVSWLMKHLKVEFLDGTGVIRIALNAGTLREQALLVNAIAHGYRQVMVLPEKKRYEVGLEVLKRDLEHLLRWRTRLEGDKKAEMTRVIEEDKAGIKRSEFELRTMPQILELADVPPR